MPRRSIFIAIALCSLLGSGASGQEPPAGKASKPLTIQAAEGLEASRWASQPLLKNPVAVTVDDQGRVFVTESTRRRQSDLDIRRAGIPTEVELSFRSVDDRSAYYRSGTYDVRTSDLNHDGKVDWHDLTVDSEKVHLLQDTDHDGWADSSTLYAEGFRSEVTGVAAGVLAHEGQVYLTVVPDLWKLRDTTGDGQADQREVIATGMGVHVSYGGHDMHGLTVGPDGMLYWTIGDKGIHVTSKDGKVFHYPDTGCVMRCNLDGSGFEVFASGIRNVQEIAFDEYGNLFGADNDADNAGETERLVYLAEGSDSGWRCYYQYRKDNYNPWMDEQLWHMQHEHQPAYLTPPIGYEGDGPSGFSYNPGTALSEKFYQHFFVSHAPGGSIDALTITPEGAGFRKGKSVKVTSAFTSIGSNFGPDGALYVADWAGTWVVNDDGAVWKIDDPAAAGSDIRKEVQRLLQEGLSEKSVDSLATLLGHADARIRLRAQWQLVERNQRETLAQVAANRAAPQLARVHAMWGLGMLKHAPPETLIGLLRDSDSQIRAQAAKLVARVNHSAAVSEILLTLLHDEHSSVRYHAAMSLWKTPDQRGVAPLVAMLAENNDRDPFLRHGGVMGLVGSASVEQLAALHTHESTAVRLAAVVALRRLQAAEVVAFLHDVDEFVLAEAARAIHDDESIPQAMPALGALLEREGLTNEAALRRAISANQRVGGLSGAQNLLAFAQMQTAPLRLRVLALRLLESWENPEPLDTVGGKYVEPRGGSEQNVVDALRPQIAALVNSPNDEIVQYALIVADRYNVPTGSGGLEERVMNNALAPPLRALSLEALARSRTRQKEFTELATQLLTDGEPLLRAEAARLLASKKQQLSQVSNYLQKALETSESQLEIQTALGTLADVRSGPTDQLINDRMSQLIAGTLKPAYRLDIYLAAKKRASNSQMKELVEQYEQRLAESSDVTGRFVDSLSGGNAARGEYLFHQHETAKCVRCHRLGKQGSDVGPPLGEVGAKNPREYLLQSLVDPQAKIAKGYATVNLALADGRVISGVIKSEDDEMLTVATPEGGLLQIPVDDVEAESLPVSSMPAMDKLLTPTEIRDLVEFLSTQK